MTRSAVGAPSEFSSSEQVGRKGIPRQASMPLPQSLSSIWSSFVGRDQHAHLHAREAVSGSSAGLPTP